MSEIAEKNKILIVDDNQTDRDLLLEVLEDEHFTVLAESDGNGAIALLESGAFAPDLILMDMSMKGLSGHTAFNIIRSDERFANIPIIFVTGREKTADLFEAQKADDFIVKPIEPKSLVHRIRKAIAKRNL